jgi:hypothetical protein
MSGLTCEMCMRFFSAGCDEMKKSDQRMLVSTNKNKIKTGRKRMTLQEQAVCRPLFGRVPAISSRHG